MENYLRHNLLNYLNYFGLESLADKDIRVSKDERYPNLYNLKYGSILADKNDPVVCACRGAVVEDCGGHFELVAYAFDRFFNLGESQAAEIHWPSAKVYEKYDGSLIKLFHWNGQWVVSTSGSVGGAGNVGESNKTFEELFWETFDYLEYKQSDLDTDNCYVFELCSQYNRIVVDYWEPELRLLAVRNRREDFNELPLEDFAESFDIARSYDIQSSEILQKVNERGAQHEGFIVVDKDGNRVKVKSDVYVQLHRVRGNGEPDFSELYLNDDLEEFLLHFPDYRQKFQPYFDKLDELREEVDFVVKNLQNLSQKEFAVEVLSKYPNVSGAMFAIRAEKSRDFSHYLENMLPKQLDKILGI
jgi:hypothetical protein